MLFKEVVWVLFCYEMEVLIESCVDFFARVCQHISLMTTKA